MRSLAGKKPPEEIIVIDRFKELNALISKIFRIIKIETVIAEYKMKILTVCFITSELLNDKKFVRDFLNYHHKYLLKR